MANYLVSYMRNGHKLRRFYPATSEAQALRAAWIDDSVLPAEVSSVEIVPGNPGGKRQRERGVRKLKLSAKPAGDMSEMYLQNAAFTRELLKGMTKESAVRPRAKERHAAALHGARAWHAETAIPNPKPRHATAEDFAHWQEQAKAMTLAELHYAIKDAFAAAKTLDTFDEPGANRYRDEALTYEQELRARRGRLLNPSSGTKQRARGVRKFEAPRDWYEERLGQAVDARRAAAKPENAPYRKGMIYRAEDNLAIMRMGAVRPRGGRPLPNPASQAEADYAMYLKLSKERWAKYDRAVNAYRKLTPYERQRNLRRELAKSARAKAKRDEGYRAAGLPVYPVNAMVGELTVTHSRGLKA